MAGRTAEAIAERCSISCDRRRVQRGLRRLSTHESERHAGAQFERHAARQPDRPFLLYGDARYTYARGQRAINRYAHAYQALGVGKGDVGRAAARQPAGVPVALPRPHKLGAVASLINTNLTGEALGALAAHLQRRSGSWSAPELWPRSRRSARACQREFARRVVDVDPEHRSCRGRAGA